MQCESRIRAQIDAIDADMEQCETRIAETLKRLREKKVKDESQELLRHIDIKQCLEEAAKEMEKMLSRRFGLSMALDFVTREIEE